MNLQEQILRIKEVMGVINEGLHDTSWENDEGDKITLMDLLNATEDIPATDDKAQLKARVFGGFDLHRHTGDRFWMNAKWLIAHQHFAG